VCSSTNVLRDVSIGHFVYKRGLCLSHSCILLKWINISSILFTISYPYHFGFSVSSVIAILWWDPPNRDFKCRCGRQKLRFSTNILLHRVLSAVRPLNVIHTAMPDHGKLVTLVARSSKQLDVLITGDGRQSIYDKKFEHYAEDNRSEFNCMHL